MESCSYFFTSAILNQTQMLVVLKGIYLYNTLPGFIQCKNYFKKIVLLQSNQLRESMIRNFIDYFFARSLFASRMREEKEMLTCVRACVGV